MRFDYPYMVVSWTPGHDDDVDRAGFVHRDEALEFAERCAEDSGMDTVVLSLEASFMASPGEDAADSASRRGVTPGLDFPATLGPAFRVTSVA